MSNSSYVSSFLSSFGNDDGTVNIRSTVLSASLVPSTLLLYTFGTLVGLYLFSFVACFLRNYYHSLRTGFPSIIVPWDQNHLVWMVASVPLRPWLKKNTPKWLYDRMSLTIYSWEFQERLRPFRWSCASGNDKSFNLLTCGRFEFSTRDAEIANEITKRPNDFRQTPFNSIFIGRFGSNVLTENGASWARHRKVVASVINERISRAVFDESLKQTEGMLDELFPTNSATAVTNGIFDMMKKITIHVLSGAGMGSSPAWNNDANEKPETGFQMTYIQSVKIVTDAIAGPIVLPTWFLDRYPLSFPGGSFLRSLGVAVKEFPVHTNNLLDAERAQSVAAGGKQRANIMSQLIAASEDSNQQGDRKKNLLSNQEMIGNLFIFTIAGFDTTANTLSYAIALLARHPQWQDWLFEEVDHITPSLGTEEWDYPSIFPKATRIMALMLETLRLYPPVIHLYKNIPEPQTVKTSRGSYWLPANSTVNVDLVALHQDPAIWRDLNQPSPGQSAPAGGASPFKEERDSAADETLFRPTRWIKAASTVGEAPSLFQPPRGTYLPWSGGPRVCPGQKMAQVEFTTVFLRLLSSCRIEAEPLEVNGKRETGEQVEERLDRHVRESISLLTLQMMDVYDVGDGASDKGLKIRLVKRKVDR